AIAGNAAAEESQCQADRVERGAARGADRGFPRCDPHQQIDLGGTGGVAGRAPRRNGRDGRDPRRTEAADRGRRALRPTHAETEGRMPNETITIGGKNFEVAYQPGEEHYLRAAAAMLDTEATALIGQIGRLPESRMLLMAGL